MFDFKKYSEVFLCSCFEHKCTYAGQKSVACLSLYQLVSVLMHHKIVKLFFAFIIKNLFVTLPCFQVYCSSCLWEQFLCWLEAMLKGAMGGGIC